MIDINQIRSAHLVGQCVGGGRQAHDAVHLLRAEQPGLALLAAKVEVHGPVLGGLYVVLPRAWHCAHTREVQ